MSRSTAAAGSDTSCGFVHRGHAIDADALTEALGEHGRKFAVNFGADLFAAERFPSDIVVVPHETYITTEDLRQILAAAYALAPAWYAGLPEAAYIFEGVSLGEIALYDFVIAFIEAMKSIRLAERIIEVERPARLVVVDDGGVACRAFQMVCGRHGVPLIGLTATDRAAKPVRSTDGLLKWQRVALAVCAVRLSRIATRRRLQPETRVNVLLSDYFRFAPIVGGLGRDPRFTVTILGGTRRELLRALWRPGRVRRILPTGYLRPSQLRAVRRYRRTLGRSMAEVGAFTTGGPQFDGYSLRDACHTVVAEHFHSRFIDYAAFVQIARAVLQEERPTHVIVNHDLQGYHRILCQVANALGVHTICYQHGVSFNGPEIDHVATTIAAWGQQERETYRRCQRPSADRVCVLGDPVLPGVDRRVFDRDRIVRSLGMDPARPIVMIAGERFVNCVSEYERETSASEALAEVCAAVAEEPDWQLLVRLKQGFLYGEFGDSIEQKHRIVNRYNRGNIFLDPGGRLQEHLFAADVVVVRMSTVGLDAMVLGKPVIVFANQGLGTLIDYVGSGAAVRVGTRDEFRRVVRRILTDPPFQASLRNARQRFLEDNFANLHDEDPLGRLRAFLLDHTPTAAADRDCQLVVQ